MKKSRDKVSPDAAWLVVQLPSLSTIFAELAHGVQFGFIGEAKAKALSHRVQRLLPVVKTLAEGAGMDMGMYPFPPKREKLKLVRN